MKNEIRENRCVSCKWGIVGRYDRHYGGCPVGCSRVVDEKKIGKCWEAKDVGKNSD